MSRSIEKNIVLLIMTSGRQKYLEETMNSFDLNIGMQSISRVVVNNDSGNSKFTEWLDFNFYDSELVSSIKPSGFGGAIRNAWDYLKKTKQPNDRYIFHLEEDFTFNEIISLEDMAKELVDYRAQIALKRQPWNEAEKRVGGFMELNPTAYKQLGHSVEHREFFTTNPSLYRYDLVNFGWPEDPYSEGKFWLKLKTYGLPWGVLGDDIKSAYYMGHRELCTHIGYERGYGFGY